MSGASPTAGPWTPKSLLDWTEGFFREKGIEGARRDAELLLAHVLHCQRIDLYLQFDRPMQPGELSAFRALVRERAERRPVAQLTRSTGFWSLDLEMAPGCFVPSQDTETLVEAVLEAVTALRAAQGDAAARLRVLELGPGSGVIPLAVCSETRGLHWLAVERSPQAAAVAGRNVAHHTALLAEREHRVWVLHGDRFGAVQPGPGVDLIVSNPPYIPSGTIARLMPEVSQFQPHLALDGGRDGAEFHRYLMDYAAAHLVPGGHLLMEMGADQARLLREALRERTALRLVAVREDLSGHPRVLHAQRTGEGTPRAD